MNTKEFQSQLVAYSVSKDFVKKLDKGQLEYLLQRKEEELGWLNNVFSIKNVVVPSIVEYGAYISFEEFDVEDFGLVNGNIVQRSKITLPVIMSISSAYATKYEIDWDFASKECEPIKHILPDKGEIDCSEIQIDYTNEDEYDSYWDDTLCTHGKIQVFVYWTLREGDGVYVTKSEIVKCTTNIIDDRVVLNMGKTTIEFSTKSPIDSTWCFIPDIATI